MNINCVLAAFFLTLGAWLLFLSVVMRDPKLTRIPLAVGNRMLRAGFGKHDGNWFVRIDLWWVGYRLS